MEGVYGHSSEILICGAIDAEIEVDEFFLDRVTGCRCHDDLRVESRGINTSSRIADNFFDDLFTIVFLFGIGQDRFQVLFEVVELILFASVEVDFFACLLSFRQATGIVSEVLRHVHIRYLLIQFNRDLIELKDRSNQ